LKHSATSTRHQFGIDMPVAMRFDFSGVQDNVKQLFFVSPIKAAMNNRSETAPLYALIILFGGAVAGLGLLYVGVKLLFG
jgi:hypothetical protein